MADFKKIAAAAVAVAMCGACLTGCSDTKYIVSYDNKKVNSGIYLYNMLSEMQQQMYMMSMTQQSTDDSSSGEIDYFSQEVEGKKFADYISDKCNESIKEYAAVVAQCEKLGIKLTDEETKEISDSVGDSWTAAGDMFEEMGISKESMKLAEEESKLRNKLFDYYYAENGKEEVRNDEMSKYLQDNYVRYKTITIAKSTETDEKKKKEENEKNEKLLEKYLKQAQKTDFDGFDKVIEAYNKETTASDSSSETETSEGTESQAEETTSSAAETDSSAVENSSEAETSSDESSEVTSGGTLQAVENSSSADESETADSSASDNSLVTFDPDSVAENSESTTDNSSADSSADAETEEQDKYANETMYNFSKMDDDTKKSSTGKLIEKIKTFTADKAEKYEDDDCYYIVIKGDVSKRADSYIEENKESLLEEMKGDDFDKKIAQWQKDFSVKENTASFKRYTPKSVYDRWNEYLKDNSQAQ